MRGGKGQKVLEWDVGHDGPTPGGSDRGAGLPRCEENAETVTSCRLILLPWTSTGHPLTCASCWGGARSGKSRLALKLAGQALPKAFVATAEAGDEEMAARVRQHQRERDPSWDTQEIPIDVGGWLATRGARYKTVVIDCLTLWLANLFGSGMQASQVLSHADGLMISVRMVPGTVVLVSNEVGMGIVPGDAATRQFRDCAGVMNQRVAEAADAVYLSVSGLLVKLK